MVFQKPNPFPMSIYDNVAYGPRTHGIRSKAKLDDLVEKSLRDAAIWNTKGVHTVEEFDPDPYLDALDKYGLPRSESHAPALVD